MRNTITKLMVIVITTAAIIAAATTTSLSAATPAFAKRNCDVTLTLCSGGSGCGRNGCMGSTSPSDSPGGGGGRQSSTDNRLTGGGGFNTDTAHGGFGIGIGGGSGLNSIHTE